jgi:hypothetical protein
MQFVLRSCDHFKKLQLSVITFNYDRVFEYFLHYGLRSSYNLSVAEAVDLGAVIPVIHVHGRLGAPIWEDAPDARDFDPLLMASQVKAVAEQLRIVHEIGVPDDAGFKHARAEIESAYRIVFLGFGYHHLNVERLQLHQPQGEGPDMFGCGYGLSAGEAMTVKNLLLGKFELGPAHWDCLEFLRQKPINLW